VTLARPFQEHLSPLGKTCGRRERESRREGRREQSLRVADSFACRDGERHPGRLEGAALRGASSERRPRSVRKSAVVSSTAASAPATADVRRQPRRGTSSAYAHSCIRRRHPAQAREIVAGARGRVLRSVLRPVHVDPHYAPREQSPGGGAVEVASRLGKPAQAGGTNTGAIANGRSAARRVSPLPQGRGRGTVEKDGGRGLPPCEVPKSSGLVARTSIVVAEVGRRRLASNKLGKRAPKRAAGQS
jgi:hypothetical protein